MALHSRIKRINEELKSVIAEVIQNEIKDPRLHDVMVTVTQVNTTKDLHQAQVYVSVFGDDEKLKEVMKALESSNGFIRHEVASRISLRYMPELIFKLDETGRNAARINDMLKTIERENPSAFEKPSDEDSPDDGSVDDDTGDDISKP